MNIKFYNQTNIICGVTMKDTHAPENHNMALHVASDPHAVRTNREQLAHHLQCRLQNFVCANQTHSAKFYEVTKKDRGKGATSTKDAIQGVDALYTYEPHTVLCTFTADCVPVIFYNQRTGVIGVIHSGWRGTIQEITMNVFNHLLAQPHCHASDFYVQIGPALSQQKFEVDEDVALQFHALQYADSCITFHDNTNKYHIDNQKTVRIQCERVGIPTDHIHLDKTCTFLHPQGFSYRENKQAGRHASFIMRKE